MKRMFCAVLAAILSLFCFCACSPGKSDTVEFSGDKESLICAGITYQQVALDDAVRFYPNRVHSYSENLNLGGESALCYRVYSTSLHEMIVFFG